METKKNNEIVRRVAENMEKRKIDDQVFYEDVNQLIEINKNLENTIFKNEKEVTSLKRKVFCFKPSPTRALATIVLLPATKDSSFLVMLFSTISLRVTFTHTLMVIQAD